VLDLIDGFILHLATERGLSVNYQLLVRRFLEAFASWYKAGACLRIACRR
jgi:integrase/recombinase XerD